jgi:tellurite resistance protein
MDRLNEETLNRLRIKLQERGQRPSLEPGNLNLPKTALELLNVSREYGSLCEAMYLMMAADGKVLNVEREVLKGAMRTLTDDTVRGVHIEAMLDTAAKKLGVDGLERRLDVVVRALRDDPIKAEVAFVVASAIALADEKVDAREKDLLDRLAEGLGLDDERASKIMEDVEKEMSS